MALVEKTRTLCRAGSMTLTLVGPMEKPRLPQHVCASSCSSGMGANKQQHSMVLILSHCSSAAGDTVVWKCTRFRMNTRTKLHSKWNERSHTQRQIRHIPVKPLWDFYWLPPAPPVSLIPLTLEPSAVLLLDPAVVCVWVSGAFQLITVCKVRS